MALAFVKSASGVSASSSVSWSFGSATTSGNLIVGVFVADDYNGTADSGWTQSTGMEQQGFHGAYMWWRISTGETSPQAYTIGSATVSAWILMEFSGQHATPYDTSNGQLANTSISANDTYSTPAITPSTGQRLLVAMCGGSLDADLNAATIQNWTNSFTHVTSVGTSAGATDDLVGAGYRIVTGDGSTTFSTAGQYSIAEQSTSGLIIAFKESASTQSQSPRSMHQFRQRR